VHGSTNDEPIVFYLKNCISAFKDSTSLISLLLKMGACLCCLSSTPNPPIQTLFPKSVYRLISPVIEMPPPYIDQLPSNLEQEPVIKETRPRVVSIVNSTSSGMVIQGLEINRLGSMANNTSGRMVIQGLEIIARV
jgi:hypothetical protein